MTHLNIKEFRAGMKAGMPVCVGYFSVSFGFGTLAVSQGLKIWQAILISASNLTSAGQFAGLTVIAAGASIIEMILTQLVINSRYALMGLALGQRLGPQAGVGQRMLASFFNTDEIFALGMSRYPKVTIPYFVGAGTVAAIRYVYRYCCATDTAGKAHAGMYGLGAGSKLFVYMGSCTEHRICRNCNCTVYRFGCRRLRSAIPTKG